MVLLRLPLLRVMRNLRAWGALVAIALATLAFAWLARTSQFGSVDDMLRSALGGLAVPLASFAVAAASVGGNHLRTATAPLVSFGASPVRAAWATVVVAVLACATVALLLAAGALTMTGLRYGAPTVLGAVVLGGASYGALFSAGAAFGPRGVGRSVVLVLDWAVGSTSGVFALMTPRAHLRNLLAGAAPLDVGPWESVGMLLGLALVFVVVAVFRGRRGCPG